MSFLSGIATQTAVFLVKLPQRVDILNTLQQRSFTKFNSPFSDDDFGHEVASSERLLTRQVGLLVLELVLAREILDVGVVDHHLRLELDALREPDPRDIARQVALGRHVRRAWWDWKKT